MPSAVRFLIAAILLVGGTFQPGSEGVGQKPPPPTPPAETGNGRLPAAQRCPVPRWIVKLQESVLPASSDQAAVQQFGNDLAQSLSLAAGMEVSFVREMSGGALVYAAPSLNANDCSLPSDQILRVAEAWSSLPDVIYAEPDSIREIAFTPDDTDYSRQWSLFSPAAGSYGINAPAAWDFTRGSSQVVVAVIDTGYTDHLDLAGRILPGYDFISDAEISNDGDGRDGDAHEPGDWVAANFCNPAGSPAENSTWHGTHVAGTIGAQGNNATGVAGINWISPILPVRVLGRCGGTVSDIVDGMRWAAGLDVPGVPVNLHKAQVLNLSLSGPGACSQTEIQAISDVTGAGATVVVAAGNQAADASGYAPANCPGVITVAATDRNGYRAYYSNYGSTVELSAPGGVILPSDSSGGILSTLNSGLQGPAADTYGYYQGTSMAAPHVSGAVSLLYAMIPSLSPAQAVQILRSTATLFPAGSTCTPALCGSGIVNIGAALSGLPRLVSLSPNTGKLGSSLTLTVNGANFINGYQIAWNGVPRTTSYLGATQLSTQLSASDLASSGVAQVSVTGSHPVYGSFTTPGLVFAIGLNRTNYIPRLGRSTFYPAALDPGVVLNGSFEAGFASWMAYSRTGKSLIGSSFPAPVLPHGGAYAAWLGGMDKESAYLQQTVIVDLARPYLTYVYWIDSSDICGFDHAWVEVDGIPAFVYDLCQPTSTGGWVRQSVNLSAYAGKTSFLRIAIETDDYLVSSFFVDDIAFSASP